MMNLLSFIAVLMHACAAIGATFKAPVYSVRKDEKWLRYKSPGTLKRVNAKTPYLSPRTQQPLRLDTARSPKDTWCHVHKSARHGSGHSYLWDCQEFVQIVTIEVGTPPQPFHMLLSISDAGLFLPSPRCNATWCSTFRQYNSTHSSTYVANGTNLIVQYERLDAFAIASADTLHFAGLVVRNFTFGEARDGYFRRTPEIGNWEWDGELGLAPSEKVSNPFPYFGPRYSTAMENPFLGMASRGLLDWNVFGLKLSRGDDDPGEIMFGDINHDLYEGKLKVLHLLNDNYDWGSAYGRWNVPATSIGVGNQSVSLKGYAASLDSDFPLISLPENIVMLLENQLGLERPTQWSPSMMNCSNRDEAEDLIISLGGHDFVLSAYEYTIELEELEFGGYVCLSAFRALPAARPLILPEKFIHLGSSFLRRFYGVFDLDERTVSLAKLKETP